MATPAHTTDLTTINLCDGTGVGTWSEPTGFTVGGAPAAEPDYYIQLTSGVNGCVSKSMTGVGSAGIGVLNGTTYTVPTDGAVFTWTIFSAPNSLNTQSAGGYQVFVGNSSSAFKQYYVRGSDTYTYGGWLCIPVDPAQTANATTGAPASPYQYNGVGVNCPTTAPTKGQPLGIDVIRYGRGEARITAGDSGGYAKFSTFAAVNDTLVNRWGLIQAIPGGFQVQGLVAFGATTYTTTQRARTTNVATLTIGTHTLRVGDTIVVSGVGGTGYNVTAVITVVAATTISYANTGTNEGTTADTGGTVRAPVDFRDSNTSVLIANTEKVSANFNTFEVKGTTSRVDLTNISFLALGTVSRGRWVTTDNATINISGSVFTDMATFSFQSLSTITSSVFRRCDLITQGGATFTACTFDSSRATSAVTATNPTAITDCNFISAGTGHGITLTVAGTYDFDGNTFTGYSTTSPGTNSTPSSGSTDAMVYNNSGGAITINLLSGTNITVRNGASATTTVVSGNVTVTLTGLKNPSEVRVFNAGTTTERAGTGAETVTSGSHSFSLPASTAIDITILSLGYQNLRILNYSTAITTSLPVSQVLDRQYSNPT